MELPSEIVLPSILALFVALIWQICKRRTTRPEPSAHTRPVRHTDLSLKPRARALTTHAGPVRYTDLSLKSRGWTVISEAGDPSLCLALNDDDAVVGNIRPVVYVPNPAPPVPPEV